MRIGVDIRPLMDREYSGVSWYTLDLLTAILNQDKSNQYFLYYNSGRDVSGRMPKFFQENVKIKATKYPNKLFNYLLQNILHWPKIDKLAASASPFFQAPVLSLPKEGDRGGLDIFWRPHINFASFSRNCRKILTIHDLSFLVFPDFFSGRQNFWHKMINVKKTIASADKIIAISENTKNDIIKYIGAPAEKICVIYSGVGAEFKPADAKDGNLEKVKAKYCLPDNFILNIGTIEPRKNIIGLVKAFDQVAQTPELKDYFLVIVGGRGWKNKDIFKALNSAENKDKIKVIGYIEKSERAYFYNLAKIFCYPSFYEGFGLPVLEAMAAGTPVITSAAASLPEVAGTAALYVDPNDINTISEAMRQLAANKRLQFLMSERGLSQAKKFSWEKTAEEYLEIFNEK